MRAPHWRRLLCVSVYAESLDVTDDVKILVKIIILVVVIDIVESRKNPDAFGRKGSFPLRR